MSAGKSLAIAAILSLAAVPAATQEVISEPGYCAFFYPNANCQSRGPGNPGAAGSARSQAAAGATDRQKAGGSPPRTRPHRTAKRAQ